MLVEEVFVVIPNYPNYAVSNYGNVVNVKYDRDVKPQVDHRGKLLAKLYCDGKYKRLFVHRLVAQAFFVDYDELVDVYHISEDTNDNSIGNLHLVRPYRRGEEIN